jgi:hypothetical protein
MSEQRLTSGGRKREKYIPLRERQQNNVLPLYVIHPILIAEEN